MKSACLFLLSFCFVMLSCKKDMTSNDVINDADVSLSVDAGGPITTPVFAQAKSTKKQYLVSSVNDGPGGVYESSDVTFNLSSKVKGVKIVSFTLAAYETSPGDASTVSLNTQTGIFTANSTYPTAKAIAKITGTSVALPDNGSKIPVTFHLFYGNIGTDNNVHSGDTAAISLVSVTYTIAGNSNTFTQTLSSTVSPYMMLTPSKPEFYFDTTHVDILHTGLIKILNTTIANYGFNLSIHNIPLIVNATHATLGDTLTVKDASGKLINTITTRTNNMYNIIFPADFSIYYIDGHVFNIYATVKHVNANATLKTHLQPSQNFLWRDNTGRNYSTENAIYFYGYPTIVTTVHN